MAQYIFYGLPSTMLTTPTMVKPESKIPLIDLPSDDHALTEVASQLVEALQSSGFFLVRSPVLSEDVQDNILRIASLLLIGNSTTVSAVEGVIDHPTDPKRYLMIDSPDDVESKFGGNGSGSDDTWTVKQTILNYWKTLEHVKRQILTCLAIGLQLEPDYFVRLHSQNKSVLRLLHYPASQKSDNNNKDTETSYIRCKPHSDYGSITLLLTDGVPGLEALIDDEWIPVPHVKGALVVNIGSLLQEWTNRRLLATLHRVVAPPMSVNLPRTSLAFFADPDPDIGVILKDTKGVSPEGTNHQSVADYIRWRSGGEGRQRSGLAFSSDEIDRANRAPTS